MLGIVTWLLMPGVLVIAKLGRTRILMNIVTSLWGVVCAPILR